MTKTQVVKQIANTFETHLGFMRPKYQYHYCLRRFRVNPDQKYIQPILVDFQLRSLSMLPKLNKIADSEFVKNLATNMADRYPTHTEKKLARQQVYKKYPEILFYTAVNHYLFMAKSYGMQTLPEFKQYFVNAKEVLSKVDWEKIFLNDEMLTQNPTGSANNIYYLKYLGFADFENALFAKIKQKWGTSKNENNTLYKNKIYGLTHLIIAASYYYQEWVEKEKFDWVLSLLESEIDIILETTSADIVAEVGLCFRLCQMHDHPVVKKCQKHLLAMFDEKKGLITREDGQDSLEKLEHRNAVAMLLLDKYDELYSGPNLAVFIREKKRFFFLPTKGASIGFEEVED